MQSRTNTNISFGRNNIIDASFWKTLLAKKQEHSFALINLMEW